MISYKHTRIDELVTPETEKAKVRLLVKREDLNHPEVSGNKWWKLKYNVKQAVDSGYDTVLTFGGAFSNHIYATAAFAGSANLNSIGIIRGEEILPLNKTLQFARSKNMTLRFVSRDQYRMKDEREFINSLKAEFGTFYMIPEGGTNQLAVKGCDEFLRTELGTDFDYLCVAVGTGGTIAGLISGLEGNKKVIGIPVLKDGDFLNATIENLVNEFSGKNYGNWGLLTSYHHGGYAKVSGELERFIARLMTAHNLPLDHVYTGKLLYAVFEEIKNGSFEEGATIMVLHSGGLQGANFTTTA